MGQREEGDRRGGDVPILIFVLLVDAAHEGGSRGQDLVHEDEYSLLRRQLDALADHVDELAHGKVGWHEVLLLINGRDVRLLDLLANNWNTVRILLALERRENVSRRSRWVR